MKNARKVVLITVLLLATISNVWTLKNPPVFESSIPAVLSGDGTGIGNFWDPYGVAVDQYGNIFVSDNVNHNIQKFDANGNFSTTWGSFVNLILLVA